MNNAQILRMLNTRIYRQLPTTHRNITFKTIVRRLINYIDRRRIRRYMVVLINRILEFHDNYRHAEVEADVVPEVRPLPGWGYVDPVPEKMYNIYREFSKKEQRCIKRFGSIIKKATVEQRFIMLNLLRILNFEPEPEEALLIAMNRNNDAINNINNNN